MRSHAKASSAGSTPGIGTSLRAVALLASIALVLALTLAGPASAASVRLFKETFGSASQPSFVNPQSLAFDQANGDVIVVDAGTNEQQQLEIKTASGAVGGTYKLSFGGQTTGWTGTGTVTCNGTSTSITGVTTTTGALVNREQIRSTPGSCIKPGTVITASNAVAGTITLSQGTENNGNSGSVSLASDLAVSGVPALNSNQISSALREALEKLPSVGTSRVTVPANASVASPIVRTVEFRRALSATDVGPITCDGSGLTGTGPTCAVTTLVSGAANGIKRFKPDGTLSSFSALGSNVIDGRSGPGAKACAEESSSCDVTAQGFLEFTNPQSVQVAIDNSGGVTNGDIFVTQREQSVIDIFASDGHYVGQMSQLQNYSKEKQKFNFPGPWTDADSFELGNLPVNCSAASTGPLAYSNSAGGWELSVKSKLLEKCGANTVGVNGTAKTVEFQGKFEGVNVPQLTCTVLSSAGTCSVETLTEGGIASPTSTESCGIDVGPTGNLYVGDAGLGLIRRLVPSANPPLASDNVFNSNFFVTGTISPCNIAAGKAGTAGYLFVAGGEMVNKIDAVTGMLKYTVAPVANTKLAVDPLNGNVLVANGSAVTEYDASGAASAVQASTLTASSTVQGIAAAGAGGNLYVSRAGSSKVEVFGAPVSTPTVATSAASDIGATKVTLNGTVDAEGTAISECVFEYGPTVAYGFTKPCAESLPADSNPHPVSATINGLTPNGTTYHFRVVAKNAAGPGQSPDRTLITASQVRTDAATNVTDLTATLNGSVNPAGVALTECKFEYGLTAAYGSSKPCTPAAAGIEADFQQHAVTAALTGFVKNSTYHFRLVISSAAGTVQGEDRSFTLQGPPQIVAQFAEPRRTSAGLLARINPSGFATTYYFEWGPTSSYGNRTPADFDLYAGSDTSVVNLTATISGLEERTQYHFRVVAANSSGTSKGPDRVFSTVNSMDLPNNRGIELVSPANKQPQGSVLTQVALFNTIQIAADGQSAVFPLLGGLADTNSGGDTSYLSKRSPNEWLSTKVSPPSLVPNPTNGLIGNASAGSVLYYSPDLSCGIVYTFNPLTENTPKADIELGVYNLYVRYDDGTYALVTDTVPSNPDIVPVSGLGIPVTALAGASEDCSKIYFESEYNYLPGASGLYEWDNGTLRDPGKLPDGATASGIGGGLKFGAPEFIAPLSNAAARLNSVSIDGSRFSFKALSNEPETNGKVAVFVRVDGNAVVEASRKQGGSAVSLGARYETSSSDGSHVFFLATYGLTSVSSSGPTEACDRAETNDLKACDLYDYDVDTGHLTNLSATTDPANTKGAVAKGVVAVSDDGESVYFVARGQLTAGEGKTYAQNTAGSGSANVYLAQAGQLHYVATIAKADFPGALFQVSQVRSHVTPDGDHLLFEASSDVTGYDSGGTSEAYLYSTGDDSVVCISCRPDGQPSVGVPQDSFGGTHPLLLRASALGIRRVMSDGGRRVFFTMPDVLAPDAVSGDENIYEWEEGQIYLLAGGPPGGSAFGGANTILFGVSASGDDVFIRSAEQLTPYDNDLVLDLYDFRVDGGFAPPPPAAVPCDPAADECQGMPAPQPATPKPASSSFSGPGNPAPSAIKKKQGQKKNAKKQRKRHRRGAKGRHPNRAANTNRGGAK